MALKAVYETQDDIPEELREQYEEAKGGKWALAIDGLEEHPKVRGVATANKENAAKRDALKAQVKELEERLAAYPEEFDPVEYETMKAAAAGDDGAKPKTDEQLTKLREQLEAKHKAELARREAEAKKWQDEAITLRRGLESRTLDVQIDGALEEAGINPKFKPAVKALLKSTNKFQVVQDGDDMTAIVETELGQVSAAEYVKTWAGGEGELYVTPAEGGGAPGNNRGKFGEPNPFAKQHWNKTAQGRLVQSDRNKAERLAKAAGFSDIAAANRASAALQ